MSQTNSVTNPSGEPRGVVWRRTGMKSFALAVVSVVSLAACGADESAGDAPRSDPPVAVDGLETVAVTMIIAGGRERGSSGCNQYEMDVAVVDSALTFGPRTATDAYCSTAPGEIEAQFASMTGGSPTWSLDGDLLTLMTPAPPRL